ncbi:DDE-type integrase/transposase/recombinase [Mycobacterium kubicae]|uniref:DDE-type integrase/transposase/recombinase n=1 Tax=Mycobacterium kubicae TaxID=120959 RepID=UPI0007FDB47E|nr:DDE-type integrase/transposase/recombinase [Mycobacterium kubicae]OBK49465.1 hypothetical protein A5657_21775 [Mycobacterium kubicae]
MKHCGSKAFTARRWRPARPAAATWPDLVNRGSRADRPVQLSLNDINERRTDEGWVYAAVVLDVYSRQVVGWLIADHLRTELVADTLDMARMRRKPLAQWFIPPV